MLLLTEKAGPLEIELHDDLSYVLRYGDLVEYRNHLRLERFQVLVDRGGENLLEAALAAGFGSYAQFHRVFRAVRGSTPRDTVRGRARRRRRPVGSS